MRVRLRSFLLQQGITEAEIDAALTLKKLHELEQEANTRLFQKIAHVTSR
jgi:SOS response regulatory protein OraA/RecX